jgi:hypothetical protein
VDKPRHIPYHLEELPGLLAGIRREVDHSIELEGAELRHGITIISVAMELSHRSRPPDRPGAPVEGGNLMASLK